MSKITAFIDTIANMFSKKFYFFAALASVIGVLIFFVRDETAVRISLYYFLFLLTVFTSYLIYSIYKIFENIPYDFHNISTFVKYSTDDGNIINFETYKIIQVKKPIFTEFEYNFKWTGSIMPKITSNIQKVKNIVDVNDATKYDKAILTLKKPAYYNQNVAIHFKAELDDADKKSSPHVETRVTNEISIIHYRIILKHKSDDYNVNAILEKKKMNSAVNVGFTKIKEIPFDNFTKSYEYYLLEPEINHYYRIRWKK